MSNNENITQKIEHFITSHTYRDIELTNTSFHYLLCGTGASTLVFLDGGMGTSESWFEYISYFEKEYQILTFSFPNNLEKNIEQAVAIKELMDKLQIKKAIFVGVSYGTLLSQLFTQMFPHYVEGVVLLSGGGLTDETKQELKKYKFIFRLAIFFAKVLPFKLMKKGILKESIKNLTNENGTKEEKAVVEAVVYQLYNDCSKETVMNMGKLLLDVFNCESCVNTDFTSLSEKVFLLLPENDFFPKTSQNSLVNLMGNPQTIWIADGAHGDPMFNEAYIKKVAIFLENINS